MYLLYLDDSGSAKNVSDKEVTLGGLCCYEQTPFFLSNKLDDLASEVWPDDPIGLEFRGSSIFGGKEYWRRIKKDARLETYKKALSFLEQSTAIRLFGAVIDRAAVSPEDPIEYGFEQLASRFDRYLIRIHKKGYHQRGLIILDKSIYETSIQRLAREFRDEGHRWGRKLVNLSDVPLFVDSKATRMVQYADMIAYALRRYYTNHEQEYFNIISKKFDNEGGVIHGLVHSTFYASGCQCIACLQKQNVSL
ncbi:MAG: DUF3800 domain-containing protein [Nitrospirae bacterium]|nr:DUF3800 domain-containing protein [Nitrospirota bacterium]